jgi:hypothetical protein
MERLIREEMIGHRMRAGLGAGRGRIVCAGRGSFVRGGARAGVGIPAESCGTARCCFADRAEG